MTAVLVCWPTPEARAMERVVEDSQTLIHRWHDRDLALQQIRAAGFTHVRVTVIHPWKGDRFAGPSNFPFERYIDAVGAIRAHGLVPQVALAWYGQHEPARYAAWTGEAARRLAPLVDRYSIGNEPDLTIEIPCTRREVRHAFGWTRGHSRVGKDFEPLAKACARLKAGRVYRRIFNASAEAVRAADPGAHVLAGETSANPGVYHFLRGTGVARGCLRRAAGWAHHPYSGNPAGLENVRTFMRHVRMPIYGSEFGYSQKVKNRPRRLADAWRTARIRGLRQFAQFGWYHPAEEWEGDWNTSVIPDDDGASSPEVAAIAAAR